MKFADERTVVKTCHVCRGARFYYLFSISEYRVVRCDDCGLVFLNPQPSDGELKAISCLNATGRDHEIGRECQPVTAKNLLTEICRYHGDQTGRLLLVGCSDGGFLSTAEAKGWQGAKAELLGRLPSETFDLCVVFDGIGCVRSPREFLVEIHRVLKPGASLFLATQPMEFRPDRLTYFDPSTIQTLLCDSYFREIIIQPDAERLKDRVKSQHIAVGGLMVFCRKVERRLQPMISVIVPAYNEARTFEKLMQVLLRKELPGMQMEIIVVESKSTDGTRELAMKYEHHPRVKLVLEDEPRGKGHAVRAGFQLASGDYVLIQDADLEYDVEDYDGLLEPLLAGRAAFVLGSRHGGRNVLKMRQFTGQRGLSLFINSGHWFFATLINLFFWQRLRDPFTMFKVFRRDCLYGLEFECDRFDFDYELLIKLIRKGYQPVELPVNYRSRSFKEGKKVRMFRDPITWLKAIVWLRFVKIDLMGNVEKMRAKKQDAGNLRMGDIHI